MKTLIFCIILSTITWLAKSDEKCIQIGKASYYADKFNGRKTASGEVFSNDSLTCAHKSLKFGTVLLVKNIKNKRTIEVRVNDRLGKTSPHLIDLTKHGAKELDFLKQGIASVEIECR